MCTPYQSNDIDLLYRFGDDISDFHDIEYTLTNGGNVFYQGGGTISAPDTAQYTASFTVQQSDIVLSVSFTENKAYAEDPSTSYTCTYNVIVGMIHILYIAFVY